MMELGVGTVPIRNVQKCYEQGAADEMRSSIYVETKRMTKFKFG